MDSPFDILIRLARIFDELPARYVVVGSIASSLRGVMRATNDVDIVVDLKRPHISPFLAQMTNAFYVNEQSVVRAVETGCSFNLIHFDSAFKVDIFIPPPGGFGWQQLARRQPEQLLPEHPQLVYMASAEDIVLAKLDWYKQGGEVSTQQWADVLGILKVSETIDKNYLRQQAIGLNVASLLEQALAQTSIS